MNIGLLIMCVIFHVAYNVFGYMVGSAFNRITFKVMLISVIISGAFMTGVYFLLALLDK